MKKTILLLLILAMLSGQGVFSQEKNVLGIKGSRFLLNGNPFEFTGVSFFNAIYNPEFNRSSEVRRGWIKKFNEYGINVFRIWCQYDNARGFVDGGRDQTIYLPDGGLKADVLKRLIGIIEDADKEGTVILLVLFSRESWNEKIRLSDEASDRAVSELAVTLKPYRNLIFQVWNEFSN